MKDNMKPCHHTLCDDVEYKEVVVIGNGPSGMVTSFMLAGNVPYLKPLPEDLAIDEMLRARLSNLPPGQSLYETDLLALAEGLEGRSQNPIPLLMDNLLRPCADLGVQADSLIDWQYEVEKQIDHIVLGRGPPGGAWHTFPPSVLTLSPGAWLSLPPHQTAGSGRLPARAVAKYCTRYVQACNLQRYFRSGVIVTSVQHSRRAPAPPCGRTCPLNTQFWVTGYDITTGRILRWWCRRVVACCGAGDRPNLLSPPVPALTALGPAMRALSLLRGSPSPERLSVLVVGSGVSAADAVRLALRRGARVLHAHRSPAHALAALSPEHYPDYTQVYNMMCSGHSENSYYTSFPEHVIASVTPDTQQTEDEPDLQSKTVKLLNIRTNQTSEHVVSLIVVLIGSKPDLCFLQTNPQPTHCQKCSDNTKRKTQSYLKNWHYLKNWQYLKSLLSQSIQSCKSRLSPDTAEVCKLDLPIAKCPVKECQCDSSPYSSGIGFGVDPSQPVDARGNPLAVDVGSHEVVKAPGVHALGPLTADNFMRFIPGGALAIVAHLHKEGLIDC